MGFKQKFTQKILNNSGSYNYYKNQFVKLNKRVERLEKANNSTNRLFNTLFLDYDLVPKELLKNQQKISLEFLRLTDNICNKYGIKYWLDYGTFLGAIRHGTFIPWDDDLDVGMMREDYNDFVDVLKEEVERNGLKDNINIHFRNRDEFIKGATSFLQLFYENKDPNWIDLCSLDYFPYDYLKEYGDENFGKFYEDVRLKFYEDVVEFDDFNIVLERYYENLNLTFKKTPLIIPAVEGPAGPNRVIKLNLFDTDKIFPLKRVPFGNLMLPGPNDSDYYLKKIYNDYWSIPKVLTFHGRFKRIRKYPNINKVFETHINKLKNINDNFE